MRNSFHIYCTKHTGLCAHLLTNIQCNVTHDKMHRNNTAMEKPFQIAFNNNNNNNAMSHISIGRTLKSEHAWWLLNICIYEFWINDVFFLESVSNVADNTVNYLVKWGRRLVVPMHSVWYTVCQKTYYDWHDRLLTIVYQAIPSMIMDLFISSSGFKLTPIVRKMLIMSEVIKFFIHNEFVFDDNHLYDVIDR